MKNLKERRKRMIETLRKLGIRFETITCDTCPNRTKCRWAYDPYNTDGDCLALK